ncbi:hypothetical protein VTI28DRAFT_7006 [Corynascus sepedonium]
MQFTTIAAVVLGLATSAFGCTPGHWNCTGPILQVCNGVGDWVESANCSTSRCCSVTDGGLNAHCICRLNSRGQLVFLTDDKV